jgi:hypothetical protein
VKGTRRWQPRLGRLARSISAAIRRRLICLFSSPVPSQQNFQYAFSAVIEDRARMSQSVADRPVTDDLGTRPMRCIGALAGCSDMSIRCAFRNLNDLADDWTLLNYEAGGSHDRAKSNPAAPADDWTCPSFVPIPLPV